MKGKKLIKEIIQIKKISYIIILIFLLQIFCPVIMQIKFNSIVYAEDNESSNGNVTYSDGDNGIIAMIDSRNKNINEIVINRYVNIYNNWKKVTGYRILSERDNKTYEGFSFGSDILPNLEKLTIPIELVKKYKKNSIFSNYNSTYEYANIKELKLKGTLENLHGYNKVYELSDLGVDFSKLTKLERVYIDITIEEDKQKYDDYTIKIGDRLFANCNSLKSVDIVTYKYKDNNNKDNSKRESVVSKIEIGEASFYNCKNLNYLKLNQNNTIKIGNYAFYKCESLKESFTETVGYPEGVKDYTIWRSGLIGKDLKYLGDYAFYGCKNFNGHFTENSMLENLGKSAFEESGLVQADLCDANKITEIKDNTFKNCKKLCHVTFPKYLNYIGKYAFYACNSEGSLERDNSRASWWDPMPTWILPKFVKKIDEEAFANCAYIKIQIPSSVTEIGKDAITSVYRIICAKGSYAEKLLNSKGIEYEVYDDTYAGFSYVLERNNGQKTARILTFFGTKTNTGTKNIPKQITAGHDSYNVTEIEANAFTGTYVSGVVVPNTVKTIKAEAFSDCSNLSKVEIPKSVNYIDKSAFYNSPKVTIYCYRGSYAEKFALANNLKCINLDNKAEESSTEKTNNTSNTNNTNGTNNNKTENVVVKKESKQNEQIKAEVSKSNNEAETVKNIANILGTAASQIAQTVNDFDLTVPEISWNYVYNGLDMVKIKFTIRDSGVGVRYYKLTDNPSEKDGEYKDLGSGKSSYSVTYTFYTNKIYYLYAKDVNGNMSSLKVEINGIDKSAPKIDKLVLKSYEGIGKKVTLEWNAVDDGVGIKYWKVSNNENDYNGNYIAYDKNYKNKGDSKVISKNGEYYLYVKDAKGNVACRKFNVGTIDNTCPEFGSISYRYVKDSIYVDWSAFDNGVGIKGWKVSTNADDWKGNYKNYTSLRNSTTGVYEIKKAGTYYLYVTDDNGNSTRKTIRINDNMIDKNAPSITKYKIVNDENNTYIEFTANDNRTGDRGLNYYGLATSYSGTGIHYYSYSSDETKKQVTKRVQVKKSGQYFIFVKDKAGYIQKTGPIIVDVVRPYATKYACTFSETGKYLDKTYYIKKGSKLKIKVTCNENIKEIDKSKIKLEGFSSNIDIERINGRSNEFYIVVSSNAIKGTGTLSVEEGYLTDFAGNKSKKSNQLSKIQISVDGAAPTIDYSYNYNKVKVTMKDECRISKYQWRVVDDNKKVLWSGEMHGQKKSINKKELTKTLTLRKHIGGIVEFYVEDIFGNSKTYTINPETKASIKRLEKNGNIVTYRIKMNLKSKLYDTYVKNLQNYQTAKNFKVVELKAEDDTGKNYLLKIDTKGKNVDEKIIIPKGTIYVYNQNDYREIEMEIDLDNRIPTIDLGNVSTNKAQSLRLSFHFADANSGLKIYKIVRLDENGNVKKVLRRKTIKNSSDVEKISNYSDSILIKENGKLKISVWDEQGNLAEKYIDINTIDITKPKANLQYNDPNEDGEVEIILESNEKITVKDNAKWSYVDENKDKIKATYKEKDITGTGTKDTVIIVDEAGNETKAYIKDKIAPRAVSITKLKDQNTGNTNVAIKLSEKIKYTDDLAGWNLSDNQYYLSKSLANDEEISLTDLAGNTTSIFIDLNDEGGQVSKVYKSKKLTPSSASTPTTEVVKRLYLNVPIQSVDLGKLEGKVQCKLENYNKTVKLTYTQNVTTREYITFKVNDSYSEKQYISAVKNIVIKGDSNNDGKIDNDDLTLLSNYITGNAENTEDEFKKFAMDVDNDNDIDYDDYTMLSEIILKN